MPSSRPTRRRRVERREVRSARRARRFALLTLLAIVLVIALLLSAFGGNARPVEPLSLANAAVSKQTKPFPPAAAPRSRAPADADRANAVHRDRLPLERRRRGRIVADRPKGNEGVVQKLFHRIFGGGHGNPTWYQLGGGQTSALDVGAMPGTSVFSPVDGTVVGLTPYVVAGHRFGSRIDIQPQSAPSLIVSVTQLRSDPSISVGTNVVSGATRIGVVADLAMVERQALARYTNDSGNHVTIELRPAASLVLN
jgi:hypothetical protein